MAFVDNPATQTPPSTSTVWRYMSLAKAMDLITSDALFFCRLDIVSKQDPFEGTITRVNMSYIDYIKNNSDKIYKQMGFKTKKDAELYAKGLLELVNDSKDRRRDFYVSCWHLSEHESSALWSIYGNQNDTIAIKTSFGKLMAWADTVLEFEVFGGMVKYLDDLRDAIDIGSLFNWVSWKRKSFEFEREVRLVIWGLQYVTKDRTIAGYGAMRDVLGLKICFDLNIFLDEIIISPLAPAWYLPVVQKMLHARGIIAPCRQSTLYSFDLY